MRIYKARDNFMKKCLLIIVAGLSTVTGLSGMLFDKEGKRVKVEQEELYTSLQDDFKNFELVSNPMFSQITSADKHLLELSKSIQEEDNCAGCYNDRFIRFNENENIKNLNNLENRAFRNVLQDLKFHEALFKNNFNRMWFWQRWLNHKEYQQTCESFKQEIDSFKAPRNRMAFTRSCLKKSVFEDLKAARERVATE